MENNIQAVEQKLVEFNGTELLGIKANDGKIYVGVRWVCDGIGLSDGQVKAERKKIKDDLVLNQGGRNFVLPTNGGKQDVLALDIDFLPLWLAKITITPNMQMKQPEVASKLIQYQLKAKDVLAEAFVHNSARQYLSLSEEDRAIAYFTAKKEQKQLQLQIEENKPLVTFAETVLKSKDNILVREMSKLIQDEGINIGEKKLYQKLRDWNLVLTYKNEPTQYAMNQQLFVVEEKSIDTAYGVKLVKTMKITPKGQIRIVEKIKKEYSKSVAEVIQNT
ncbi:phage antirepressor KilAC domain-containing protein [Paenibacillus sp. EKM102P]|uniref:phage antirepressor N-terminal domain-containing protein n=1 Tax=Paenibacillus TaxID=44249 RepID=UPI00142D4401|nr:MULTISPECIES: phage antirepressor N-terminal domain-containing protein [unclassified Paenibacillus]KAF6620473.1 phage antirepressor KilAC domain-containing protein [Paenibacillus sp. EKM101P]KAF6623465.1 phage antirepressor KilAC domain-containing protein [Paenibacillus sp. EKM102P]KAF6633972.1 phage antirepressor KilAC domain-containing protein [Paenibacillus sp. EKM10P]KAF6649499.1 phage antirepressor KilAC domain-containing protein [Paenibacillus sp. EKM11P]